MSSDKKAPRINDFAMLSICMLTLGWTAYSFLPRLPKQLVVDKAGSDWWGNGSEAAPFQTIQTALNYAMPGDEVIVGPGTYAERIHFRNSGTQELPIRLKAARGGEVTISSATRFPANSWTRVENSIWTTKVDCHIAFLRYKESYLFRVPWGGVEALKATTQKINEFPAFVQDNESLYVYLPDDSYSFDSLTVHENVPPPQEWGIFKSANLWIEASHVRVEGFRFEFGVGASIRIWWGTDIEISDCSFEGATYGVLATQGGAPISDLRIRSSLFHNYPQGNWIGQSKLSWNDVYAAYSSSSLLSSDATGVSIFNSVVTHCGDAIRVSPSQVDRPSKVEQNWISYCSDDAIEMDGQSRNLTFQNNFVYNAHESLGLSPVLAGPVTVRSNFFVHPQNGLNGAQLKLINELAPDLPIRNVLVESNFFFGEWLCWHNSPTFDSVIVRQNRFVVDRGIDSPIPATVQQSQNEVIDRQFWLQDHSVNWTGLADYLRGSRFSNIADWDRAGTEKKRPGPTWWKWEDHPATRGQNLSELKLAL